MAQTARVTLTLSNIATEEDLRSMEERIMSALSDAVAQIQTAVSNLTVAQSPEKIAELQAALEYERQSAIVLREKIAFINEEETAEDVEQNRQLAEAQAQVDALLAEMNTAATDLQGVSAQLASLGTAVDEAPDATPVGEVEVPEPAPVPEAPAEPAPAPEAPAEVPDAGVPADGGAPAEASPTDAPSSPTTTDAPATTDGTPADAGTGVTDAAGNPVPAPNL